jgi:hypothetical protein
VKKPAKFRYTFFGLAILACLALWYFLVRVPYTRSKPVESDLAGIYRPDFKRHALFLMGSHFPPANSEIKVEAGGKIELINVFNWLRQGDTNTFESVSTNGSWHLEKYKDRWLVISEYKQQDGNVTIYFDLIGKEPPYSIRIYTWQTGTPFYFVQGKD